MKSDFSAIVSLAILKTNWDNDKKDYIDNFKPLILECLDLQTTPIVSVPALQNNLKKHFGLTLPQSIITVLVKRLLKTKYLTKHGNTIKVNKSELASTSFNKTSQLIQSNFEDFITELITFVKQRFRRTWTKTEANEALVKFLNMRQHQIVKGETILPVTESYPDDSDYIIPAFIQQLNNDNSNILAFLDDIVKGYMLSNAIYFSADNPLSKRKFKATKVFFDTRFLMYSLGYGGETVQVPCLELLELLHENKASLACFEHTVDEMRGILNACLYKIENNQIADAYGPTIEYFLSQGAQASDIQLMIACLEKELERIKISVVPTPSYDHYNSVIGESEFTELLNDKIAYPSEKALERDVQSVAAIVRLRKSKKFYHIEDCQALFVSKNGALVSAARKHMKGEGFSTEIPPCMTDYALTTYLWLKLPTQSPKLPLQRIVADCFAMTQPDKQLWMKFLSEIENLREKKAVTPEEYFLLRHTLYSRQMLMDLTLGKEQLFTEGSIPEILEFIKNNIKHAENKKIEKLKEDSVEKTQEINRLRTANRALEEKIKNDKLAQIAHKERRATRIAQITTNSFVAILLLALIVGLVFSLPDSLPRPSQNYISYLSSCPELY